MARILIRPGGTWLARGVLALALLALPGCLGADEDDQSPGGVAGGEPAPNFVLILTDDQEVDSLRFMPAVRDLLGSRGVTYPNSYVSVPECCPARASLLTGQYAHNHGVRSNNPPDGGFNAFEDGETLPVWLREAGYRTAYVGKYLNGYGWEALGNDPTYVPPGWDFWAAFANHSEYSLYGYDVNLNGEVRSYGEEPEDYQTDVVADLARSFVDEAAAGSEPFYLQVAPSAPHDEGALEELDVRRNPRPAPRHEGRYEEVGLPRGPAFNEADVSDKPEPIREDPLKTEAEIAELATLYRSRLESLLAVDDLVRGLVRDLRAAGELERTVFVFTSDNGFLLGQHRQKGKSKVYEESAGVPLVISGPGFAHDETDERLVSNVDLTATIVAQSGASASHPLDGVSLVEEGGRAAPRPPILIENLRQNEYAAIRDDRYILAEHQRGGHELYDLEEDPAQLRNLFADPEYREIRRRLHDRLEHLRDCAGAGCRPG